MTIDEQVEIINTRMFRNRLSNNLNQLQGWQSASSRSFKPIKTHDFIKDLLSKGHRVTAGFYSTACRGFHEHYIFWK